MKPLRSPDHAPEAAHQGAVGAGVADTQVAILAFLVPAHAQHRLDAGVHAVAAVAHLPLGGGWIAGVPDVDGRAVVLHAAVDARLGGRGEVLGDVAGVELQRAQAVVDLVKVGVAALALRVTYAPPSLPAISVDDEPGT